MSQKSLTKEQIYQTLKGKFPSEQESNLREVSYNLCVASVTEASVFELAAKSLEKLKRFAPKSVLAEQAAQNQTKDSKFCPVCKVPMKLVKLLEDKTAHYCPTHKIAEPLPIA